MCWGGADKIIINPIIDWDDDDVWEFLNNVVKVKHCCLYDEGWRRIGCLFCPMASKKNIRMMEKRYPKYKAAILRTIQRMMDDGLLVKQHELGLTPEDFFEWWISKINLDDWAFIKKHQLNLFNEEDLK